MIKFGDIAYFELLRFRDRLKNRELDRMDLVNLDRLRNEVQMKIDVIDNQERERRKRENLEDTIN
jgi:hypothetical protein